MTAAFRALGAFCAFGKLPSHADFVQFGPRSETFSRFDQWLTQSVEWAHRRTGAAFCEAFRSGDMRAFAYRCDGSSSDQPVLVGALAPSQDQAGRLFPLCVATPVILATEFSKNPELVPFAFESIWQIAGECIAELGSSPNAAIGERISGLRTPSPVLFCDAEAAYREWSEALLLSELCSLVTGSERIDLLAGMLSLLVDALPNRKTASADTPLSLRLPLGTAGGAAVCFWLDAVRRLVGARRAVPSIFWSHDGSNGRLTVHLGSAPVASISELWLPTRQRDEFCDLTLPPAPAALGSGARLAQVLARTLKGPSSSVGDLLAALSSRR